MKLTKSWDKNELFWATKQSGSNFIRPASTNCFNYMYGIILYWNVRDFFPNHLKSVGWTVVLHSV